MLASPGHHLLGHVVFLFVILYMPLSEVRLVLLVNEVLLLLRFILAIEFNFLLWLLLPMLLSAATLLRRTNLHYL